MGKHMPALRTKKERRPKQCKDSTAPISASECCDEQHEEHQTKELLVIGAGPHSLALLLRLLEPDADFLSEKERHIQAEHQQKQRPLREVRSHIKKLSRGPSATLKPPKRAKAASPPPLSLDDVRKSVVVVDTNGQWLARWNSNFEALNIPSLRSPSNAHADPFDHRSLALFAQIRGQEEELVTLPYLTQRDAAFRGPYEAPSTSLFTEYHDLLARAYGIHDIVKRGTVQSIIPTSGQNDGDEPIFRVEMCTGETTRTIKAKRVVCALGPMFQTGQAFWEESLRRELGPADYPFDRILHANEIVDWLRNEERCELHDDSPLRLLIVGGGISSVQMALLAANKEKSPWCHSVTYIQRSKFLLRQFDLENHWMGPGRGKLLEQFWSLDMAGRAKLLQQARRGGSVPPEIVQEFLCQYELSPRFTQSKGRSASIFSTLAQ